jgi:acyl-CoA synthetase (AMP-forming)/AMP-acid ligase II
MRSCSIRAERPSSAGKHRFSYQQFGERVGLLAGALLEAGIKSGDRVAYFGVNSHRLDLSGSKWNNFAALGTVNLAQLHDLAWPSV